MVVPQTPCNIVKRKTRKMEPSFGTWKKYYTCTSCSSSKDNNLNLTFTAQDHKLFPAFQNTQKIYLRFFLIFKYFSQFSQLLHHCQIIWNICLPWYIIQIELTLNTSIMNRSVMTTCNRLTTKETRKWAKANSPGVTPATHVRSNRPSFRSMMMIMAL